MAIEDLGKSEDDEKVSVKELILKIIAWCKYLLSKWIFILLIGLIGVSAGIVYSLLKKITYYGTTSFVLEEDKSTGGGLSSLAGLASIAGVDLAGGGGIFQGDNILELYKSRTMITKTLLTECEFNGKKQSLLNRYIEVNNLREKWDKKSTLKNIQFSDPSEFTVLQDSLIGLIVKKIGKENLNVNRPDKKLSIINVEVKSDDEQFAKAFGDRIVANVNEFYIATKVKKSKNNVNILQHQVDSVRKVMGFSINTAAEIADATPNLNPTRQAQRIAPIQRSQFSAESNKLILGELLKNLELAKLSLRREEPLIQIIDNPIFPLDNDRIGKMKAAAFGGILAAFLATVFLVLKKNLKNIISE